MKKVIFIVIILIGAYHKLGPNNSAPTTNEARQTNPELYQKINKNGFIEVYMPNGSKKNQVLVLTPIHCTAEEVMLGKRLEEEIRSAGLDVKKADSFQISSKTQPSESEMQAANRTIELFNSPPAVLINGFGKSKPTVAEILEIYELTK